MSVKVTFEFDTREDAAAFLLGDSSEQTSGADKPKRGRPAKAASPEAAAPSPAAPAAAPAAAASAAPAATQAAASTAKAVPFQAVADAITELAEVDTPKAKAILQQHGVAKASDLKPEQFASVVAAAKAALVPSTGSGLI